MCLVDEPPDDRRGPRSRDIDAAGLDRGDPIFVGSQATQPVLAENDISTGSTAFVSQAIARTPHDRGHTRRIDGGTIAGAFGS